MISIKKQRRLKILLVSHGWPLEKFGGVGLYVQMLIHEFFDMGHSVFLLTPQSGTYFVVHRTNHKWGVHISLEQPPISRFSQTWKWTQRDNFIEEIVLKIEPDVIHMHHLDRLGLCVWEQRLRHVPILYTLHDYASICTRGQLYNPQTKQICGGPNILECASCLHVELQHNPLTNWIQNWIPKNKRPQIKSLSRHIPSLSILTQIRLFQRQTQSRRLLHHVFLISPSYNLQKRFVQRGFGKPLYIELPLLRDLPDLRKTTIPQKRGFLFAGSLIESKGLDLLLKAFEGFPEQTLTIAGSGPLENRRNVYPQHNWLGHVEHHKMMKLMLKHHTVILPSLWPENAPIILREAAALGLNIICTLGGGQEISKRVIVVERTVESLREGIENVISVHHKKTLAPQRMLHRRQHSKRLISYYDFCIEQNSKQN
jgi:glycosyltransferase involved in cell wall biosynthesis